MISRIRADEDPVLFFLKDIEGAVIDGSFYRRQLRPVTDSVKRGIFVVDKVLEEKKEDGQVYSLVKYKGSKEPHWVLKKDLVQEDSA